MRSAFFLPILLLLAGEGICAEDARPRPLMKDFIGLNVHTVQFKPELYAPVARVLRNYHPIKWDFGDDTSAATTFPLAANRVNWAQHGEIAACQSLESDFKLLNAQMEAAIRNEAGQTADKK